MADNSLTTVDVDYNFTVRSSDVTSQLSKAQIALNSGQFTLADQHLDTALSNTSQLDSIAITNIYFYKGIVSLRKPNYSIAIENFSLVANYNNSILRKDAIWLRGLAYIKVENFEAAKKDFNTLESVLAGLNHKKHQKFLNH